MGIQEPSGLKDTAEGKDGIQPEIDFDIDSLSCNFLRTQHSLFLALGQARSLSETLLLCMDAACQVSTMESGGIYLLDDSGGLNLAHTRGVSNNFIETCGKHSAETAFTQAMHHDGPFYDISSDWDNAFNIWFCHEGIKSVALIPIVHKQKLIGCVCLSSRQLETLSPARRLELETLASLIAMLINESQADVALRASQVRYEAIFEQAAVGIAQMSPDGRWLRVNHKFCEIVGYSREELLKLDFQALTPDKTLDGNVEFMQQLRAGEIDNYTKEKRYIRKDGRLVWINLTVSMVRNSGAEQDYLIAVIEDIQVRKESEQTLRRFSRVIEQTASAIFTTNSLGVIDYVNPRFTEMSGYTYDEAIGHTPPALLRSEFPHPDVERQLLQTMQKGREWKGELRNRRRDGAQYWVSVIVSPVRDDEGLITNFVAIHDDISERKYAEAALKTSEMVLRKAQRMARIGNWKRDLVAKTASWSDVIYHILGRDPSLPPATFEEMPQYFTAESWARLWRGIDRAMHDGIPYGEDAEVIRPDGSRRWIHSHGEAEYGPDGNIIAINGMVQDITERKNAEETQKRFASALKLLSQCRMALVHAEDERQLLQDVCRLCIEISGYVTAWVGYAEDGVADTIQTVAFFGRYQQIRDTANVTWVCSHHEKESIETSLKNITTVISRGYMGNPKMTPWRDVTGASGYQSTITLPLIVDSHVLGVLNIYSTDAHAFGEDETSLLEELAGDLAYGIGTLRNRIERMRTEQALAEREAQYRAIIDSTSDGFWIIDEDGCFLDVNDAYIRCSGYSREELLTMSISDVEAHESPQEVKAHINRVREQGSDLFESLHRTKKGDVWPVEINTSYWTEAGGRIFVFVRDISQRKILERQIIEVSTAEQERIGREIHDGIGQQLTAVGMLASSLARKLAQVDQDDEAKAANALVLYLQQLVGSAKSLAKGLSPIHIGPNGLPDALTLLVDSARSYSDTDCRLQVMGEVGVLDEIIAVHLYRITQEAINNAIKHSRGDVLDVYLHCNEKNISLSVHDNGIGIDLRKKSIGLGLHIMRYRAGIIGAKFSVNPVSGGGTCVKCTWNRKI